ncbi:thioredoxin reductase [Thermosporothrix hazakensis]|jgi:NADPH-dependent 2,4-dienoyl-CoA reductase/sulfur reductase-like enzyme|uniref:Thioredoxin reductase n=1 Tax=Thermosporothrix hazakensis TaxID=644383 RepID=A0A326UEZ6_THEHA|nr:FAD/NAD(P)-binding oxidoreductase [Thermosporothrix hazakensis]PZW29243.1 thioredoxin reductase [Thermosporothrix hazakensis]GCE45405.1 oxidoreductase [Thermosporothrix hazakensis]
MKTLSFAVLVVGAGPAGLAAATSAARGNFSVGLLDENPAPGGQIWRGGRTHAPGKQARVWLSLAELPEVTPLYRTKVVAPLGTRALLAERPDGPVLIEFERLILATGARERFLPFPGWTLPGVMGAGGLQALVKGGLPVEGKRIVVAGSGPLLLAVAAFLKSKGAHVLLVAEQTPWHRLGAFALQLPRYGRQFRQAGQLGLHLYNVPFHADSWVTQAHGDKRLMAVSVRMGGRVKTLDCDYLACGFGLVPNSELAAAFGCELFEGSVRVDAWQRTSVEGIYCVGEATGIGGVDVSLAEGQIAGYAAIGQLERARTYFPAREKAARFAALLARNFALRDELRHLATDETLLCRCEDVPYGEAKQQASWRSARLQTRCGMGPCQGRVCGAAASFLFGWTPDSVRPPVSVARVETLALTPETIMRRRTQ